ncbi:MAG: 2-amino-4-hydroxy-6-hydroxymethyldihydropteridine diphosphokinase [Waddliaceae bacterium]|nr:2-amino-4-hydroxy-6-hydroxymethyldihydropteridine diphosphokinase [Waddliaceae bacterium]
MVWEVYLGLGGNIGDSKSRIQKAFKILNSHPRIEKAELSPIIQTDPVSDLPQEKFQNAVCKIITNLLPVELFSLTEEIEKLLGKVPKAKNAPRKIDIDLLLYGNLKGQFGPLSIPHPEWLNRSFVLQPLAMLTDTIPIPGSEIEQERMNVPKIS